MNKRVYDVLKFVAQIALPAAGTLYFTLAAIWGLPNADAVVGTVMAVDTFLGVLLRLSSKAYNSRDDKYDGVINIHETEDRKLFQLQIPGDPNAFEDGQEVLLKVNNSS